MKEIILVRDDLGESKKDLPVKDINIYDFKNSSMNKEQRDKAELITFRGNDQIRVLKDRYGILNIIK
ncbi:MAG: hypothetical protein PF569_08575 [Candidatus Woesearchaeota archaeon]|jgi:hypothetical protein|nr:hypothetical protein [Candidatus Woesearchaeota archaeon]